MLVVRAQTLSQLLIFLLELAVLLLDFFLQNLAFLEEKLESLDLLHILAHHLRCLEVITERGY